MKRPVWILKKQQCELWRQVCQAEGGGCRRWARLGAPLDT